MDKDFLKFYLENNPFSSKKDRESFVLMALKNFVAKPGGLLYMNKLNSSIDVILDVLDLHKPTEFEEIRFNSVWNETESMNGHQLHEWISLNYGHKLHNLHRIETIEMEGFSKPYVGFYTLLTEPVFSIIDDPSAKKTVIFLRNGLNRAILWCIDGISHLHDNEDFLVEYQRLAQNN